MIGIYLMKLIKPKAEYLPQANSLEGVFKQIEIAGRTCYKSEDKITEDSAKGFVDRMIASKHTAMLEHGTVYLNITPNEDDLSYDIIDVFMHNEYSKCIRVMSNKIGYAITTNLRVIVENCLPDSLKYLCEPTEFHEKRYTMKFTTSIGVSRELNRHRVNSIAEQSTRYCNYSKDKFNNEISFINPVWNYDEYLKDDGTSRMDFFHYLYEAEDAYMNLLKKGWQPQQAREVLPLCTATEIVHTAFASDWRHFFDLRLFAKTGEPHPNMKFLVEEAKIAMEEAGIWEDIMKYPSKLDK